MARTPIVARRKERFEQIEIAVLRTKGTGIDQSVRDAINLMADGISIVNPMAGIGVKVAALAGGWFWNRRKFERAEPLLDLVGNYLKKGGCEYVRKEEFADILEDALRRTAVQPDSNRRFALRSIIENVMKKPQDHTENRLFLRLADELPNGALQLLFALDAPVAPSKRTRMVIDVLEEYLSLERREVSDYLGELVSLWLVDTRVYKIVPSPNRPLDFLLTRKGRAFVDYCHQ